jgi:trimeric autotransporter adhesin
VAWTNLSDGRYKTQINRQVPGLEFILKLSPVTYHMNVNAIIEKLGVPNDKIESIKKKEQIQYTGFIAQEVEEAANEIGYEFSGVDAPKNENDLYGLRYAEFVVPLVKGMQEQQIMIEELKLENEQLIKQNEAILQRLIKLEQLINSDGN